MKLYTFAEAVALAVTMGKKFMIEEGYYPDLTIEWTGSRFVNAVGKPFDFGQPKVKNGVWIEYDPLQFKDDAAYTFKEVLQDTLETGNMFRAQFSNIYIRWDGHKFVDHFGDCIGNEFYSFYDRLWEMDNGESEIAEKKPNATLTFAQALVELENGKKIKNIENGDIYYIHNHSILGNINFQVKSNKLPILFHKSLATLKISINDIGVRKFIILEDE